MTVVRILFAALFTIAACFAAGWILLRRLRVALFLEETLLFSFVTGTACLSLIVFVLAAVGQARKGVFTALGITLIAWAARTRPGAGSRTRLPRLSGYWKLLLIAIFVPFAVYYFVNALAPEYSPDGSTYHLGLVARYLRQRGFGRITNNLFANFSQGFEMLYLFAFGIGRHSAAAMVHFGYLIALPLCMLSYSRRFQVPAAGVFGALLIFASPVFGIDGTTAYNDVAAACVVFCAFYLLQIWRSERQNALLIPIGLLAGFAYAIKYTAFLAVPYCIGMVLWTLRRSRSRALKAAGVVLMSAALMMLPWMIKDWVTVSNPFSPFLNRLFPNPYISISFEKLFLEKSLLNEGLTEKERPWDSTVRGGKTVGMLGPVFLLAPLALLALRQAAGRQLLLAAGVFGVTSLANYQSRFLMSSAPFISLALGLALMRTQALIPVLIAVHAFISWPNVLGTYCDSANWRLRDFPIRAALRIEPEEIFLTSRLPGYEEARMIDRLVPAGGKVFSFGSIPDSYTSREILMSYESAANLKMREMLWMPLMPDLQPNWRLVFRFPRQIVRQIRVIQTKSNASEQWTVGELRIFRGDAEVDRAPGWKLQAHPNPWDVHLAFDKSPVTRWNTQQTLYDGMYVNVDFGRAEEIDLVAIECSHDQWGIGLELEGETSPGTWKTLSAGPTASDQPAHPNLRGSAARQLKAEGVTHLLINNEDYAEDDFRKRASDWRLSLAAKTASYRLYRLD